MNKTIQNYAHDYRDIAMNEKELELMLTHFVKEYKVKYKSQIEKEIYNILAYEWGETTRAAFDSAIAKIMQVILDKEDNTIKKETCSSCNEYQTAKVNKYCPAHRYCDCDVAEVEDGVCINCERQLDPALTDYYADIQAEADMEAMA